MTYDYDKLFGETSNALGEPSPVFVDFFNRFKRHRARVLDVGCGQGRDTIFIARKGHIVVGVDISPNGIRDLTTAAQQDNLAVEGIVADISVYRPEGEFDVILVDRTLHMLSKARRLSVLQVLLDHVGRNGWLLIADEKSNISDFEKLIFIHRAAWKTELRERGYLFVCRT